MDNLSGTPFAGDPLYASVLSRTPHNVDHEGQVTDSGLRAAPGITCYACDAVIHDQDWIRRGPQGTRHDTCP